MRFDRPHVLILSFSVLLVLSPSRRAAGAPNPALEHGPFDALWRPVAIHLWYPARPEGEDARMSTRDYVLAAQITDTDTALEELRTALALDPGHERTRRLVIRLDPVSNAGR